MESLLRKYLWALDLLVIALCAVFLARASASLVSSRLPQLPPPKAIPRSSSGASELAYSKDFEQTLKRNIFCSTCPPILKAPENAETKDERLEPVKTALPIQLVATAMSRAPSLISRSLAMLRDTETKAIGPFGIGQKVKGATVTEIQEKRVYLDNAGKPEYLDLFDEAPAATPSPSIAVAPPPSSSSSDPLSAELDKGIKKLGEHNYEIQRQTLESVLGNMSLLSRSARIVPEIREGKAAGFRLYSVRPDGPFAKIGMQNGDVISSINGLEITSPEKALEVYAKLKSASHLSMQLERNGQRVTKDYNIR